jgi:c-di-AMP phosphodiesterase-like protein
MNNLYLLDRISRIIFSLILLYLSGAELNFYTFFAITLLATASLGYCPIYKIFGINLSLEDKNKFLTQLPKYNPEPVFIFSDEGNLIFQNNAAKKILPELKFFKELSSKNPKSIIKNKEKTSTRYSYKDKTYLIESIGIQKKAYIFASQGTTDGDFLYRML